MSRHWIALVVTLALGASVTTGCSFGEVYLTDPLLREVALNDQQKHYSNLIRWSAFNKAAVYVKAEERDAFMKLAPPLKDFRFTDFESQPIELNEEGDACTVEVVYYGYRTSSPFEVEVRETQRWTRDGISNEWLVSSTFDGLDEAQGRAAAR